MKLDLGEPLLGEPLRLLYRGRQMFSDAFADCIRWWHPRFPRTGIEPHLQEKLRRIL